jgi:hypothetical protein
MVLAHPTDTKTESAIGVYSASLRRARFVAAFFLTALFLDPDALEFLGGNYGDSALNSLALGGLVHCQRNPFT